MRRITCILVFLLSFYICTIAQVYEMPVFDRSDVPALHIDKVEISKDATCVFCSYDAIAGSWANISKDTYLLDVDKNIKYPLLKCEGLPFGPEKKTFLYGGIHEIVLCFPPVKISGKIDIIETPGEQSFNIYGINVKSHYSRKYSVDEMDRFSNMASFYETSGDTTKAINNKKEELRAAEYIYGTKSDAYLLALQGLGFMYDRLKMFPEAINSLGQLTLLQAEVFGSSNELYALQLRTYGQIYSHAKMYEQAIHYYKESVLLYEKLGIVNDQYVLALGFLSDAYRAIENEPQSIVYQNEVIQARRRLEDSEKYLNDLEMMLISGHSIDRIKIVERELNNLPHFVDTTSVFYTNVLKAMMVSYEVKDSYGKAIYYCDRSLSILKRNEEYNILRIAELQGKKCRYLRWSNHCREAILFGENAKTTFDTNNVTPESYITILEDLAWCYGSLLDFEKALSLQELMVKLCADKKDWLSIAEGYNQMGLLFQSVEKLGIAENYVLKAIDVLNNHDDAKQYILDAVEQTGNAGIDNQFTLASINQRIIYDKGNFTSALGRIYQKEGRVADAIAKEKESGEIIKNMGDEEMYAEHLGTLAQYYLADKQFDNAKKCAEQSILYFGKTNSPRAITEYMLFPLIYIESGNIDEATRYAEEAVRNAENTEIHEMHFIPQVTLSRLYFFKGDTEKAERMMSEALNYLQSVITDDISDMTSEQKQRMWDKYESFFLQYRNIIEKSNKSDSLLSKLYNYLIYSKSLLLESDMHKDLVQKRVRWQDIQQHLADNDIAIEFFFTYTDSIYSGLQALIIDKKCEAPRLINLFSYSDYKGLMTTRAKSALNTVGNLVWREILKHYSPNNIYFCPDGLLHMVPIEHSDVDGIGVMIDHYNIFRLSSTKELLFNNQQKNYNKAVLYGGLDYEVPSKESIIAKTNSNSFLRGIIDRGGFEPLPNTYDEIQNIANLLNNKRIEATLYSGINGTEDSFKKLSGEKVNIMHLSTHGMFVKSDKLVEKKKENNFDFLKQITNEKDPVKEDIFLTHSFIVMSGGNRLMHRKATDFELNDGILTAYEISQLDLSDLDLVVLSACETGLGQLEFGGVFGLQRGFKKAGANTILMSVDKVDDEATKILMVEFYRNLMDGKTKHQSLKNAQRYLRQVDNGKYDKPEYWASFIMLDGID